MASTIQLKTGTGSAVPANLTQGELAINVDNGLVYYGSGSTNTTKKLETFTNITASGHISASGHVEANRIYPQGISGPFISTRNGQINSSTGFTGINITASSNISASGDVMAKDYFDNGTNINTIYSPIEGSEQITSVGTISEGTWNGVTIASANLDADTAHLTTDQTFSGKKTFSAAITASGNISASGTITANKIESDQLFSHVGDANTGIQLSSDSVQIEGNDVIIANFTTSRIELNSPITASGNISASGTVTAAGVRLPGAGIISFDNSLDGTDQFIKGGDHYITIEGDDIIKLKADTQVQFQDNSGIVFAAINPNAGHITSSGNISASGTIYGRQWEQIETNLTANIGSLSSGHDGDDFIFLPWTDTDTENAGSSNKFVNRSAVAPGKPIKTSMRATSNTLGDTAYTMSLWENKTDQGNNNLVLVTEACGDSTGTNREVVTFDWTNPCSGSNVDITYGSKMWMGIKTTNGNATYAITHLWEWDYGSL